ncbi:MAG: sensor histidine kinase [Chloroflexi bacterium]|nr:sensor histidine kinase [Chloroflexota bacterium]
MSQFLKLDPAVQEETKETRAFYYLLLLVIIFIYGITLIESPIVRQPARLIPFTLLMALHAGLHWFSAHFILPRRRLAVYLVAQISLVVILSLISRNVAVSFSLVMAMAGETAGMLEDWRQSFLAALGYLGLLALDLYLIGSWQIVSSWLGTAVIILVFIFIYVALFMRQMSARLEAQSLLEELESAHQQLAEYAQQVETLTLETERQRMARELHDTLAQGLAGVILQLEALEAHLEKGSLYDATVITGQAKTRARATLADARRAIVDLREQANAEPLEAIGYEIERFTTATGIPCQLDLPPPLHLSPAIGEHAARCVSEGLANVTRHARASQTWITLAMADGRLRISIRDDGIGFNPDQIAVGHYGLIGLRERARLAGGTLDVESEPGRGTTLRMELPIDENEGEKS